MHTLIEKNSARLHRQQGVAVLESVIVLPIVIFIILIVGELGNAILQYNTLTQTVRNAARYVAEEAEANSGIINLSTDKVTATKNLLINGTVTTGPVKLPDLGDAVITVSIVGSDRVSVEVAYDYQPLFFPDIPAVSGISGAGGAFTMHTEIIMRVL